MILLFSTKTQTFPHSDTGKNPDRDKDCRKINHCMKTNPTIEWPGFARGNLLIRAVLRTPIKHNKSHPRSTAAAVDVQTIHPSVFRRNEKIPPIRKVNDAMHWFKKCALDTICHLYRDASFRKHLYW